MCYFHFDLLSGSVVAVGIVTKHNFPAHLEILHLQSHQSPVFLHNTPTHIHFGLFAVDISADSIEIAAICFL